MEKQIKSSIEAACKKLFQVDVEAQVTRPSEQFGDYATNVSLQLVKHVDNLPSGGPRQIGEQLAEELRVQLNEAVSEISVAGPGFLNFRLSDKALIDSVNTQPEQTAGEVVIETNNPNPFKAMHIGHAFNSIVADTIANILEASGKTVHRVSYHGDVGTHVGKSMYSLLKYVDGNPQKLMEIDPKQRNAFMSKMYAEGSKAYKEDPAAKARIDELTKQSFTLEDPVYKQVYETCKAWSFDEIDNNMQRIGNKPIEKRYLESQADELGVQIVKENAGEVFVESDGALVFPGSKYGSFDNVFVGSSGRGLYAARDLGLMKLKNSDFPDADKSYIVTAEEQRDYFVGVIKAAELALPELAGVTVNISTGMVKLSTGKMSSREGDVVEIAWLFDQIAKAVQASDSQVSAEIVAGALRYEFLKVRIGSDVIFDIQESVSVKGNSGPYLQYAHARARSILRKTSQSSVPEELQADERKLLRKISEYPEVITKAGTELMPHVICSYIYELSQEFNRFYESNRVIGDAREAARAYLVNKYAETLKHGLNILGIHAPDSM